MRRISSAAASVPTPSADTTAADQRATNSAGSADDDDGSGLTALERERAAIIARNRARMEQLQLPELAAGLSKLTKPPPRPRAAPTQRGVGGRKRNSAALNLPPRTSLRSRGIAPDGGMILHEGRDGRVVVDGAAATAAAAAAVPAGPPPKGTHVAGQEAPFESFNCSRKSDAAFLALLRRQSGPTAAAAAAMGSTGAALARFRLSEADVAKVTKTATTCMGWHPNSAAYPLIAAGDKAGQIGLWAVDFDAARDGFVIDADDDDEGARSGGIRKGGGGSSGAGDNGAGDGAEDDGDDYGAFDGIATFNAHASYIAAMRWVGGGAGGGSAGARLLSVAWDGSARLLDPEAGKFLSVPGLPEPGSGTEFSAADAEEAGGGGAAAVVYLATPEGDATIVDMRAPRAVATGLRLHDRKINTLALGPAVGCGGGAGGGGGEGRLLASAASDGTVRVWDARRLATGGGKKPPAPLSSVGHPKSSQGASWAPDGSGRLLSVSFDDTLKVWGQPVNNNGGKAGSAAPGTKFEELLSVRHDNQTGRWVIPFRPAWWGPDALLVGDMKRGVCIFDANSGARVGLLQSPDLMTAIPSRLAPWGAAPGGPGSEGGAAMLAAATNSGRVHVFRC